jgi:hypothetical protein
VMAIISTVTSYMSRFFRISKPHFSPAAAWYLPIIFCTV